MGVLLSSNLWVGQVGVRRGAVVVVAVAVAVAVVARA
jgi:hypothetical protein